MGCRDRHKPSAASRAATVPVADGRWGLGDLKLRELEPRGPCVDRAPGSRFSSLEGSQKGCGWAGGTWAVVLVPGV